MVVMTPISSGNARLRRSKRSRRPIMQGSAGSLRYGLRLLRQRDRLQRERAGVLGLVVADDVGQLAFRDSAGIADLRHRDRFGKTVLDGVDFGVVALDRDLVEFAVAFDQQQAAAKTAVRTRRLLNISPRASERVATLCCCFMMIS